MFATYALKKVGHVHYQTKMADANYGTEDAKNALLDGDLIKCGDTFLFNPFNPVNKEISAQEVQAILTQYGITAPLYNIELYKRAFVHSSYVRRPLTDNTVTVPCPPDCLPLKSKSNERLEFVGDGVLELITKYYLYKRFPKANEGFMTEKKIALVKNEHIGKLAYDMQLNQWLILSRHAEEKKTRTNLKRLGCLFEALIGAIFLDFNKLQIQDSDRWFASLFTCGPGFQMAQVFVEKVFETHVDWTRLINFDDNFKNILQVKIQKEFKTTPHYLEISYAPDSGYEMGVFLCVGKPIHQVSVSDAHPYSEFGSFSRIQDVLSEQGHVFVYLGHGVHKIKKKAEQIACEAAISCLE